LSAMHTKAHFIRAVMEGVAYSLRDCKSIISEMGTEINDMMACGGGGTSPLWRSMLADLYDCPVKTVTCKEGPALGVAILAFVGTGVYESVEKACEVMIKTDKTQEPDASRTAEYEKYYQLYTKLYGSIAGNCKELAAL
ncbi:MAG: xylulokinase, partial [Oscillospiraceae bacterium]|nr:xylulokinase [Oscillospiraceae bacterium]